MSTECCDNDQKENKKNLMNKNEDTPRNSLKIEDSPSRLKRQSPNSGCKNCSGCNGDLITRSPFSSPSKGSVTARMKQETPISKKDKNKSEHSAISIKDHGQKKSRRSWHVSSESSKEPVLSNELQIETLKVKGRPRLPWDELSKSSKERRMKELRRQSLPVYLADANQKKKGIFVSLQNIKKKTVKQKPQNVESVKIYTPPGWRREVKLRKSGLTQGIKDVFYISPTGKRFQHKRALESYCLKESIDVDFDRISFSCNNSPETTLKKNIAKKPGPVPKKDILKGKNHKQNYTSKRKPASKNKVVANRIRGTKRAAELNKRRAKILSKNVVREIQTSTSKTLTMQPEPEFINEQFQRSPTKYGEYQVEEIIARREQQGKNEYLVKWQGWSPSKNTWEPVEHMHGCQRMLKEYKEHLKQRENVKRNLWENKCKQNVACSKSSNSNQDEMTYSVPMTDGKRKRNHQIFNGDQDNLVQADSVTIEITEPEIDSVTMSALTKLKENTTINNYECDNEYKDNFFAVAQSPQTIVIKTPMKKMIQEIKERRITGVKRKLDEANENNDVSSYNSEDSSSVDTTIVTDIDAMNQTIVNLACSICGAHQSLCFRKSNGSASPAKLKLFCITCKNYIGNSERDKCHSVDSEYNKDGVVVIEKEELNAEYLKHDKKINLKDLTTIRRVSPRKKNSAENLVSFKTVKFYGARRKEIQNENISSPYPKLKNSVNILSPSENEPLRKRRSLTEKQNNAENIASNIASNKNLSSREKLQNKNENLSVEVSPSNRYKNKNKEDKCNEPTIEQVNVDDDKKIRIPKLSVELMKAGNEEENSLNTNKNDTDPLEIDDISCMKIKCEKVHAKKQSIVKHYEIGEILIPSIESDKFPSVDNSFPNTPPGSEEENCEDPLGVSLIPGIVF